MQILIPCFVAAVAAVQTSPVSSPASRSEPLLVRTVFDGDTIDVAMLGRVRLLGIDAPEIGRGFDTAAPFGREARDRLAALVLRRWVRLERDGPSLDTYNRHLAYVMLADGLFVNAVLVREGLARVTARQPLTRLAELKSAEAEAQAFRRGMWGATPRIVSPGYTRRSVGARSAAAKVKKPPTKRRSTHKKKT
jgi:micrococcal nuclease